jgi:hypothetical protein
MGQSKRVQSGAEAHEFGETAVMSHFGSKTVLTPLKWDFCFTPDIVAKVFFG